MPEKGALLLNWGEAVERWVRRRAAKLGGRSRIMVWLCQRAKVEQGRKVEAWVVGPGPGCPSGWCRVPALRV